MQGGIYTRRLNEGRQILKQLRAVRTRREVGKMFGITGQCVEQIELIALTKIAIRMKEAVNNGMNKEETI